MIDVICAHDPMSVGESRILQVAGNGPFTVKVGFFVTDPAPVGLNEQTTLTVDSYQDFEVKADEEFWSQRKGGVQIDIVEAAPESVPSDRYEDDGVAIQEAQKRYVRRMAALWGWTITEPSSSSNP